METLELRHELLRIEAQLVEILKEFERKVGMRVANVFITRKNGNPNKEIEVIELNIEFRR